MTTIGKLDENFEQYFSWQEIFQIARSRSPFYRELYKDINEPKELSDLPLVDAEAFWQANVFPDNRVLTTDYKRGHVFGSGGTTGRFKLSFVTREEFETRTTILARGIGGGILEKNDRIANMMMQGPLWPGFLGHCRAIEKSGLDFVSLPVGGAADFKTVAEIIVECKANAIICNPTRLMDFALDLEKRGIRDLPIKKILYLGEPLFPEQAEKLKTIFQGVKIASTAFVSSDGAVMGRMDSTCKLGQFIVNSQAVILEIVDVETGKVINEPDKVGTLYLTNLGRIAIPNLRYPTGDMAKWIDPSNSTDRRFELCGRSSIGVKIGSHPLRIEDLRSFLSESMKQYNVIGFQVSFFTQDLKDRIKLIFAVPDPKVVPESASKEVIDLCINNIKVPEELVRSAIRVEWCVLDSLKKSPAGKILPVVDLRFK